MTTYYYYYVLEEVVTGRLMPVNKCKTRAEFGDPGVPRLFASANAASQALNCWRMGWWRLTGDEDAYWPEPPDPKWSWCAEISARRKATHVRIRRVALAFA